MTNTAIAYGQALFSLAYDEGLEETVLRELTVLQKSFADEPDFLRLLRSQTLSKLARCQILDNCFRGKVTPYVLHFLKLLTEKGDIHHFSRCCDVYRDNYNRLHNILPVTATTALPLTKAQLQRLNRKLSRVTGKTVQLLNHVDAAVLGGVRLEYNGIRLDDTLRHRLEDVGALLKESVL